MEAHTGTINQQNSNLFQIVQNACHDIDSLEINGNADIIQISEAEISQAINGLKPYKAPGMDSITNILLKKLPQSAIKFIKTIFYNCFKQSYFPLTWKIAKITPIPKPGKDHSLTSSYRPISLLSCLGKVFEHLIKNRMQNFIEENNILINQQFGFRAQHSTVHQVHRITNYIKSHRAEGESTGMILLDLERAFDTVWTNSLLLKLLNYKLPIELLKILKSYFSNRKFYIQIMSSKSSMVSIPAGVPQGAVLSPILFNLFINDIPLSEQCEIAIFADDTAIYTANEFGQAITENLQSYVDTLSEYYYKWGLKVNGSKSDAIYFTRCRALRKLPNRKIVVQGDQLEWKNNVKYLGIFLDKRLTFKTHISEIDRKCDKLLKILYPLINRKAKLSCQNKILIYKCCILNAILYGIPVWWSTAKCHRNKLQIIQNKFLKIIKKLPRRFSTRRLHLLSDMLYVEEYADNCLNRYVNKLNFVENSIVNTLNIST